MKDKTLLIYSDVDEVRKRLEQFIPGKFSLFSQISTNAFKIYKSQSEKNSKRKK